MNTVLSPSSAFPTLSKTYVSFGPLFSSFAVPSSSSSHIELPRKRGSQNTGLRCNCSIWPGGPGSGDSDSSNRSILDAFFLGKAVAEALNERIESTVGEILSTVGRLQAEQQKQVQDFQEEVLERAKKSKENAAREAMEAQGFISKSAVETKVTDSTTSKTSNSATGPVTSVQSTDASETDSEPAKEEEPTSSTSDE
ncbi:hypothetical protein AAZX31_03G072300 [Glycine max]|uniref:Uncharacterized protein n=1 Tax=Glycine max TaxID=3847 RepID=K7KDF5_SOYBN|nr:uncharacterized protein At4g13200, chloroplastic [Glycine max]XP_028224774.1 uncharacterized protein At4g13200, chloroplastic [Glycine soja]KAG5054463.1 hypothetical protein JHK85_006973 [Glycine max]KAG5071564.1 hypothetical protein JHK86_006775 [Glycine max]KAH1069054.1 hypothetical protein GYH30_006587 [Glycine max]KAH1257157.1 chloroplastic protein [Glycine max]KRH66054.1 hypothetical protein GLYMA_03G080200v4 [Glycine max]|eukprot:XP_014629667.2 uncharacterized protein At4g13200, chloroplastic [Glycine max]